MAPAVTPQRAFVLQTDEFRKMERRLKDRVVERVRQGSEVGHGRPLLSDLTRDPERRPAGVLSHA